jgi:oligoribonuclease
MRKIIVNIVGPWGRVLDDAFSHVRCGRFSLPAPRRPPTRRLGWFRYRRPAASGKIAGLFAPHRHFSSKKVFMSNDSLQTADQPSLAKSEFNLIWIDMEMTGLSPDTDRVIEIAAVVTDLNLSVAIEGPVLAIHQSDAALDAMDQWNKNTHGRSGLIERVRASNVDEQDASAQLLAFLAQYVPPGKSPMCGNSICQDRRFMARWMPELETFFHYRNLDVSTLKELCRRWQPTIYKGFQKRALHTALADIHESIDEMKYYREHFLRGPNENAAPVTA